jgi:hypothetical protein
LATLSCRPLRTSCWIVGNASPSSSAARHATRCAVIHSLVAAALRARPRTYLTCGFLASFAPRCRACRQVHDTSGPDNEPGTKGKSAARLSARLLVVTARRPRSHSRARTREVQARRTTIPNPLCAGQNGSASRAPTPEELSRRSVERRPAPGYSRTRNWRVRAAAGARLPGRPGRTLPTSAAGHRAPGRSCRPSNGCRCNIAPHRAPLIALSAVRMPRTAAEANSNRHIQQKYGFCAL